MSILSIARLESMIACIVDGLAEYEETKDTN